MSDALSRPEIEYFEERAAICEYCALLPRANAESIALREVSDLYGKAAARRADIWRKNRTPPPVWDKAHRASHDD